MVEGQICLAFPEREKDVFLKYNNFEENRSLMFEPEEEEKFKNPYKKI